MTNGKERGAPNTRRLAQSFFLCTITANAQYSITRHYGGDHEVVGDRAPEATCGTTQYASVHICEDPVSQALVWKPSQQSAQPPSGEGGNDGAVELCDGDDGFDIHDVKTS